MKYFCSHTGFSKNQLFSRAILKFSIHPALLPTCKLTRTVSTYSAFLSPCISIYWIVPRDMQAISSYCQVENYLYCLALFGCHIKLYGMFIVNVYGFSLKESSNFFFKKRRFMCFVALFFNYVQLQSLSYYSESK